MKLINDLEILGLSQKEAEVYLACLHLGSGNVSRLTQRASLPKSTVIDTLKSLIKKGLVDVYIKGRRKHYSVVNPEALNEKIKKQLVLIEEVLPQLKAFYNFSSTKPKVRFYEGEEGLRLIMNEIIKEAKDLIAFGSAADIFTILPDYFPKFSHERAKKGIPLRVIFRDSPKAHERQTLDKQELRSSKIIQSQIPFSALFWSWQNKLVMITFKKDVAVVLIEDEEIAQTFRSFFEFLWSKT